MTLRSKAHYDAAAVEDTWLRIEQIVPIEAAHVAVKRAATECVRLLGSDIQRATYCWSGGKDSLALQVVMDEAQVQRSLLVHHGELEFPAMLRWFDDHVPNEATILIRDDRDLAWLAATGYQHMFPKGGQDGYYWTTLGTRWGQKRYWDIYHPSVLIMGRRTLDGNPCGDANGIQRSASMTVYNPIRHWSHEMTLAVVRYFWLVPNAARTLPPCYQGEGWKHGTGSWPGRHYPDHETGWAETYRVDPEVVVHASLFGVPGAQRALESLT
jgi:hypothetical protein